MHCAQFNVAGNDAPSPSSSEDQLLYASDLPVTFVHPVSEDYQCHICLNAARDAVVTEHCGHLFCRQCISKALEQKNECPVDRLPLTMEQVAGPSAPLPKPT